MSASRPRANGFPDRDEAAERELTGFYEQIPELEHEGRRMLELITAIYKSAITAGRVTLPLAEGDPFRTRDGLLAAAPRFHEKTVPVAGFADNAITTTGGQG